MSVNPIVDLLCRRVARRRWRAPDALADSAKAVSR
jgi:hypothetical protein